MYQQRRRQTTSLVNGVNPNPHIDKYLFAETGFELLAYLQYTIDNDLPLELFAPNVRFHCKERLQKIVSSSEIEDKFRLFWTHWHHPDSKASDWTKIYHLGIKGLPRLEEEKVEWVKERARSLKDCLKVEGNARLLRSASHVSSRLRNASQRQPRGRIERVSIKSRRKFQGDDDSPTPRKKRASRSTSAQSSLDSPLRRLTKTNRSPVTPSTKVFEIPDSQEADPNVEESLRSPTPSNRAQLSLSRSSRARSAVVHNNRVITKSKMIQSNDQSLVQSNRATRNAHYSQLALELDGARNRISELILELDGARNQISDLISELDDLRNQKPDEVRYWKELYLKTQKVRKALRHRNKLIQGELAKAHQDDVSNHELKLRDENDLLKEQVNNFRVIHKFKAPFRESYEAQSILTVFSDLETLVSNLQKVLQGQEVLFSIENWEITERSELPILLRRSFGLEINDVGGYEAATALLYGIKLRAIVMSLISAALCMWVFEIDVGALFHGNSHTYLKLRSLLAAQDRTLTECLEFAAHEECIKDPFILDSALPGRARYLSRRVSGCIQPLLEAHRDRHHEFAEIASEWSNESQQLTEIFRLALSVKARLLLTTDLYKCAVPVPGAAFDNELMEEWLAGDAKCSESDRDAAVCITIFPGLLRYAAKEEEFGFDRFLTGEKAPKKVRPEILMRAIVLAR